MTHEETWRLLPRYASGELETTDAAGVRAHLATGCAACVEALFRGALVATDGGPRPGLSSREERDGSAGGDVARRRGRLWEVVAGGLVVLAGVVGWQLGRGRETPLVVTLEERARLARLEATEATRNEQLQRLTDELQAAEEKRAQAADAARAAGETNEDLRRELAEALARAERAERPPVIAPLPARDLARMEARRLLVELASRPGVVLDTLLPVARTSPARGHVFWHAQRSEVVLFAFGLPGLPSGAFYRVRMLLDRGWVDDGTVFRPTLRGEVVARLRVPGGIEGLRGVELVAEPEGTVVLRGRTGAGTG